MAIYPFYTTIDSSTRRTIPGCGVRKKDGSMTTRIYQRDKGEITQPYTIYQSSIYTDGKHQLKTSIEYKGKEVHSHVTDY